MTSLAIPNSVTEIGGDAFCGCSGLTSVTIPNSVTSIGDGAFQNCSGLTSLAIPNFVTKIGPLTFNNCSGLSSVTIGNSVTSISAYAFQGCNGLKTVNWNAKNCADFLYAYSPFKGFTGITTFNFGNEVMTIPSCLCYGLSGLTSILIPYSVTSIGDYAFKNCNHLVNVTNFATTPQEINANVFENIDLSLCNLYVLEGSYIFYILTPVWREFNVNVAETVAAPTFNPAAGTYSAAQNVTIDCATEGVDIYYTLDDSNPAASSMKYTGPIAISASTTVKAIAVKSGMNNSAIAVADYTISSTPVEKPATPTFNPAGSTYFTAQNVTIACATEGAEIYYTLDGSSPMVSSTKYTDPITVSLTTTIKAIAVKSGIASEEALAEYIIKEQGGEPVGEAKLEIILESKADVIASNDGRFSTGYGDYIYVNDKANGKVVRYDKSGIRSDYATVEGLGTAITSDDAGNLLVNKGFPGAVSSTDWVIIEPDGTQHALTLTFPDAVVPAREDVAGRVIGDVMSVDGAYLFLAVNGAQNVVAFRMVNGAQDSDAVESLKAKYVFDTSTIARSRYESVYEIDADPDPSTAVVYRKRGNLNVYGWDEDGYEIVNYGAVENSRSCDGFDIFKIGDIYYSVEPSTDVNYADGFAIRELGKSENIVVKEKTLFAGGSQRFQSLTARVFNNQYAIIYQNVSGEGIGMYKFTPAGSGTSVNTIGNNADVVATIYYNLQGVRIDNPSAGQIYIRVATLSDGSVRTSKVVVR